MEIKTARFFAIWCTVFNSSKSNIIPILNPLITHLFLIRAIYWHLSSITNKAYCNITGKVSWVFDDVTVGLTCAFCCPFYQQINSYVMKKVMSIPWLTKGTSSILFWQLCIPFFGTTNFPWILYGHIFYHISMAWILTGNKNWRN